MSILLYVPQLSEPMYSVGCLDSRTEMTIYLHEAEEENQKCGTSSLPINSTRRRGRRDAGHGCVDAMIAALDFAPEWKRDVFLVRFYALSVSHRYL